MTRQASLQIYDDPIRAQGGFAALEIAGAGSDGAPSEDISIIIGGGESDAPYLGPNGWQASEHYWKPTDRRAEGDALIFVLGPEISGQIEDFTPLQITIPALDLAGVVIWDGITPPQNWGAARSEAMGSAQFEALSDGRIRIVGKILQDGTETPFERFLGSGDSFCQVSYNDLAKARRGEIRFDPIQQSGRISRVDAPAPATGIAEFRVAEGGPLVLEGTIERAGATEPFSKTIQWGEQVFSLPWSDFEAAESGKIKFDPDTNVAEILEIVQRPEPEEPELPEPEPDPPEPVAVSDPPGPGGGEKPKPMWIWFAVAAIVLMLAAGVLYVTLVGTGSEEDVVAEDTVDDEDTAKDEEADEPVKTLTDPEKLTAAKSAVDEGRMDEAAGYLGALRATEYGPALLYEAKCLDSLGDLCRIFPRADDNQASDLYVRACKAKADGATKAASLFSKHVQLKAETTDDLTANHVVEFKLDKVAAACGLTE